MLLSESQAGKCCKNSSVLDLLLVWTPGLLVAYVLAALSMSGKSLEVRQGCSPLGRCPHSRDKIQEILGLATCRGLNQLSQEKSFPAASVNTGVCWRSCHLDCWQHSVSVTQSDCGWAGLAVASQRNVSQAFFNRRLKIDSKRTEC